MSGLFGLGYKSPECLGTFVNKPVKLHVFCSEDSSFKIFVLTVDAVGTGW